jgi:hypothetical protein
MATLGSQLCQRPASWPWGNHLKILMCQCCMWGLCAQLSWGSSGRLEKICYKSCLKELGFTLRFQTKPLSFFPKSLEIIQ